MKRREAAGQWKPGSVKQQGEGTESEEEQQKKTKEEWGGGVRGRLKADGCVKSRVGM